MFDINNNSKDNQKIFAKFKKNTDTPEIGIEENIDKNMTDNQLREKIALSLRSRKILQKILNENHWLEKILKRSKSEKQARKELKAYCLELLEKSPDAYKYYTYEQSGRRAFEKLRWKDYAIIRLLDYIDNAGLQIEDQNQRGRIIENNPIKHLWLAYHKKRGGGRHTFFMDMLYLFRQMNGRLEKDIPSREQVEGWMDRYLSGLDERIIEFQEHNKQRILSIFVKKIDEGIIKDPKYKFEDGTSQEEKIKIANKWWEDRVFHLRFAVRDPEFLNELLANSLDFETMDILRQAAAEGIPFFVNPYYLSLLNVYAPDFAVGSDLAIRDYIFYSKQLVDEFGHIVAWEKEDVVEPGKPNVAGWLLPTEHNMHRRYPEVAILIPDNTGRACGGLCSSCQRMYDFQRGNLNFDLDTLEPTERWPKKLAKLMDYFENDSTLRDILITGGDALMATDKALKRVLDAVYDMAVRKKEANKQRKEGEKYAEMLRVRLGTRLPAYLPQRVTPGLLEILKEFKAKASKIGIKQFVIQTHFESPMEVTPTSAKAVQMLISAGWIVTNQHVFTAASSRRGHTAKLRQVLNSIGVITYYTFSVKGFMENYHNFATNARAVQEQLEEKVYGFVHKEFHDDIRHFPEEPEKIVENIKNLQDKADIPFLATDRNVLNMPGVGKSLTFRTIGITRQGRRILQFDHDHTRNHSPILNDMGRITIVESKPISHLIRQYEDLGEDVHEYHTLWGYTIGETEKLMPIFEYPDYDFDPTDKMTNLEI